MITIIRIVQILLIIAIVYSICTNPKKEKEWKYLTIASWVYYFCGISALGLLLSVCAELEDDEFSDVSVIFIVASAVAIIIMWMQRIWMIKYNEQELYFRNSFGRVKKYDVSKLTYVERDQMCEIHFAGKKVIEWPSLIMDMKEDIQIARFLTKQVK